VKCSVGVAVLGADELTHDSLYSTVVSDVRVVQLGLWFKTDSDMRIRRPFGSVLV